MDRTDVPASVITMFKQYDFIWNNNITTYKNKHNNKCINEFEIQCKIDEGAVWKVYYVKRYFYNDNKEIQTKPYALKKTHILTQSKHRYYKNDECISYLDEVYNEIHILGILGSSSQCEYVIQLYELLFDIDNKHPYIYLINDYCDIGPIMNRDQIEFNHFHNPKLIKHFLKDKIDLQYDSSDNNLIAKHSVDITLKHSIAKVIFKQILLGLQHIHSKRISHRDIKMENILFTTTNNTEHDGVVKIIDFSISTIIPNNVKEINEPGGSMHYQAPEMFDYDKKGYYDPFKIDYWAVGVCLYIFIFEQFPFDDESELALQMKISNNKLEMPFSPMNTEYEEVLNALLEKDPNKRICDVDKLLNMNYFI